MNTISFVPSYFSSFFRKNVLSYRSWKDDVLQHTNITEQDLNEGMTWLAQWVEEDVFDHVVYTRWSQRVPALLDALWLVCWWNHKGSTQEGRHDKALSFPDFFDTHGRQHLLRALSCWGRAGQIDGAWHLWNMGEGLFPSFHDNHSEEDIALCWEICCHHDRQEHGTRWRMSLFNETIAPVHSGKANFLYSKFRAMRDACQDDMLAKMIPVDCPTWQAWWAHLVDISPDPAHACLCALEYASRNDFDPDFWTLWLERVLATHQDRLDTLVNNVVDAKCPDVLALMVDSNKIPSQCFQKALENALWGNICSLDHRIHVEHLHLLWRATSDQQHMACLRWLFSHQSITPALTVGLREPVVMGAFSALMIDDTITSPEVVAYLHAQQRHPILGALATDTIVAKHTHNILRGSLCGVVTKPSSPSKM